MPQNTIDSNHTNLSWKEIRRAALARLDRDLREHVFPKVDQGRDRLGAAIVAIGRKLQTPREE